MVQVLVKNLYAINGIFGEEIDDIFPLQGLSDLSKNAFFLSIYFLLYKNTLLFLLR